MKLIANYPAMMIAAAGFFASAATSSAAVTMTVNQVGADVVLTVSGSLVLAGLTQQVDGGLVGGTAGGTMLASGPTTLSIVDQYEIPTTSFVFGSNLPLNNASSGAGDGFFVVLRNSTPSLVGVPNGYISGSPINSTSTWAGTTLAGMGLTDGFAEVFTAGTDTISLTIVPEPSSTLCAAVGILAAALRRKRRA